MFVFLSGSRSLSSSKIDPVPSLIKSGYTSPSTIELALPKPGLNPYSL